MNALERSPSAPPNPVDLVADVPEHLQAFYSSITRDLPKHYSLSGAGICQKVPRGTEPPFCSAFRVKALVRDQSTDLWSRLVELVNPDNELVECIISNGKLDGKPREAIMALSDRGFFIFNDFMLRDILQLIRNWPLPPNARQVLVEKVGWTPDHEAFLMPDGRHIARSESSPLYRLTGDPSGKHAGNLAAWREGVAALSIDNPNLIFALALGFSTALLTFTDLNSLIFHFYRKTSKGKTRLLQASLTIWPRVGDRVKSWDATINGLEGEIARSNSILLGLDELPKDVSPDFGNMIYKIANGIGKARGEKDGSARTRMSWQTSVC